MSTSRSQPVVTPKSAIGEGIAPLPCHHERSPLDNMAVMTKAEHRGATPGRKPNYTGQ